MLVDRVLHEALRAKQIHECWVWALKAFGVRAGWRTERSSG